MTEDLILIFTGPHSFSMKNLIFIAVILHVAAATIAFAANGIVFFVILR
jgi:hypothetical protein